LRRLAPRARVLVLAAGTLRVRFREPGPAVRKSIGEDEDHAIVPG
jgi:hypothetical protein